MTPGRLGTLPLKEKESSSMLLLTDTSVKTDTRKYDLGCTSYLAELRDNLMALGYHNTAVKAIVAHLETEGTFEGSDLDPDDVDAFESGWMLASGAATYLDGAEAWPAWTDRGIWMAGDDEPIPVEPDPQPEPFELSADDREWACRELNADDDADSDLDRWGASDAGVVQPGLTTRRPTASPSRSIARCGRSATATSPALGQSAKIVHPAMDGHPPHAHPTDSHGARPRCFTLARSADSPGLWVAHEKTRSAIEDPNPTTCGTWWPATRLRPSARPVNCSTSPTP